MVSAQTIFACQKERDKLGFSLSLCLIILAAELLVCKIRQDKEIQDISILGKELKLSQFADDTTFLKVVLRPKNNSLFLWISKLC